MNVKAIFLLVVFGFMFIGGVVAGVTLIDGPSQAGSDTSENSTVTPRDGTEGATATPQKEITEAKTGTGEDSTEVGTDNSSATVPINESKLEGGIENEINTYRCGEEAEFGCPLSTTGDRAGKLDRLAKNHSRVLLQRGEVWTVGSRADHDFKSLYEHYGLYSSCQYKVESYIDNAQHGSLMSVGKVNVSSGNESAIAEAIVDDWRESELQGAELNHDGASRLGVGVAVDGKTNEGYVTSAVC